MEVASNEGTYFAGLDRNRTRSSRRMERRLRRVRSGLRATEAYAVRLGVGSSFASLSDLVKKVAKE